MIHAVADPLATSSVPAKRNGLTAENARRIAEQHSFSFAKPRGRRPRPAFEGSRK